MTYPRPREPKQASIIAYLIVGAVVVLLAIGVFFFAREVREESKIPAARTAQAMENSVGFAGREPGGSNTQQ